MAFSGIRDGDLGFIWEFWSNVFISSETYKDKSVLLVLILLGFKSESTLSFELIDK